MVHVGNNVKITSSINGLKEPKKSLSLNSHNLGTSRPITVIFVPDSRRQTDGPFENEEKRIVGAAAEQQQQEFTLLSESTLIVLMVIVRE